MPVLKLYHHGLTAGVAPERNDHARASRGVVRGWTEGAARRNALFLYSVREGELTGFGGAYTLTVRDCPPSHDDWRRLREAWFAKLRRLGLIRAHWVTEWQRRGVPHLHCAIWFDIDVGAEPLFHWYKLARDYGAGLRGQHYRPIYDEVGWFQYLAKHAVRGLNHYQRSPENVPDGWERTGRLWGYLGDWPRDDAIRVEVPFDCYHRFRRLLRGYVLAEARAAGDWRRVRYIRRMLNGGADVSRVKGMSEWVPLDLQIDLVMWLRSQGYEVDHC